MEKRKRHDKLLFLSAITLLIGLFQMIEFTNIYARICGVIVFIGSLYLVVILAYNNYMYDKENEKEVKKDV